MSKSPSLPIILLCAVFIFDVPLIFSHSEHGPYADFEAPGFQWTESPPFSDGLGRIFLGGGYGFIDKTGNVVLQKYPQAEGFSEGLAAVSQNKAGGPWGYIDKTGALVIPYQFEQAEAFSDGLAKVFLNGKCGYIDKLGKLVVPPQYDLCYPFFEGRTSVRTPPHFTYSIIDRTGRVIVKDRGASRFSEGLAFGWSPVREIIDREGGSIVLDRVYDWAMPFSEGLAAVGFNGQGGFVDKTGKLVLNLGTTLADSFSEGLAPALRGKRWGYIDRTGAFKIKPQFEMAQSFSEGLAPVRVRGKWGYIDRTGTIVIKPVFGLPGTFSGGLASVQINDSKDQYAYIDKNGKIVWQGTLY